MINEAVYGHNQDEGIVCVDAWGNTVTEYIQRVDGTIVTNEINDYDPWHVINTDTPNLNGDNHFNTLIRTKFTDFKSLYERKEHIDDMLLIGNKANNYLIDTGKTLFKGVTFDEVHTAGFDIETTGLDPDQHQVKMISLVDNRGFSKVIYNQDEFKVLAEFIEVFNRLDPTIILGYNSYSFDIPFLMRRCELHGIGLGIGRNFSMPFETKIMVRLGTGQQDFRRAWRIFGRHCIDLYYVVMKFDFVTRKLNNYKLKNVISQYGLEREGRVHVGYAEIFEAMESGNPKAVARVSEYCLDDSRDLINLHRYICEPEFYLTQIIPMNYQTNLYSGVVGRVNTLMMRDYLHNQESIPTWHDEPLVIEGARVEADAAGIFKHVGDSDITSMYPNLMIQNEIFPKTDSLHSMKRILIDLKNSRIASKRKMKMIDDPQERTRLMGQDKAMKGLINGFFGVLGSAGFYWRDNEQCASVTRHGRELIIKMKEYIESEGFKIIALDTDGIAYTNGQPLDVDTINAKIQSMLPIGIDVESQVYPGMIVFKKKTYTILHDDGSISSKGAAMTAGSIPPFVRRFIMKSIDLLFKITNGDESYDSLKAYYEIMIDNVLNGTLPITDYMQVQRVVKDLTEYADGRGELNENGNTRQKLPLYELMIDTGRILNVGEKTETYWSTKSVPKPLTEAQRRKREIQDLTLTMFEVETVPKMIDVKTLKWVDEYSPSNPDINIEYYVDSLNNRVYDLLGLVIPKDEFNYVFSKMKELKFKHAKDIVNVKNLVHRFTYKDLFGKYYKKWQRIDLQSELEYMHKSGEDLYVTIQRFMNPEPTDGEMVYHPIYFDLDSTDLNESFRQAKLIYKVYTNVYKVKPESITVWFSGSKGFHIEIAPEVYGVYPMSGLTLFNKEIALKLMDEYKLNTLDIGSIYSSRRMWRLPFSINSKSGIRKTWIPDLLAYEDMDDLMVYIKDHQDVEIEFNAYTKWLSNVKPSLNLVLNAQFTEYVAGYKEELFKNIIRKPLWKYKRLNGKLPNCIEFLRTNSISKPGDRNLATMVLLSFFKESGVDYETAVENVVNWTLKIPSGLTSSLNYGIIKKNVQSVANTIYKESEFGKKYVFECKYALALMHDRTFECPTICPLRD
jgi:DNA polymerase, archaea type